MVMKWQAATAALLVCLIVGAPAAALAQVTTGTVTGTVKDPQGGTVPGATVTLTSVKRGTSLDTTTNENGDFTFPNVTGDTYNIKITLEGFKTLERPNIQVSPGDRVGVGVLAVEVGALNETVTVGGDIPVHQVAERRAVVHRQHRVGQQPADCRAQLVRTRRFRRRASSGPTPGSAARARRTTTS